MKWMCPSCSKSNCLWRNPDSVPVYNRVHENKHHLMHIDAKPTTDEQTNALTKEWNFNKFQSDPNWISNQNNCDKHLTLICLALLPKSYCIINQRKALLYYRSEQFYCTVSLPLLSAKAVLMYHKQRSLTANCSISLAISLMINRTVLMYQKQVLHIFVHFIGQNVLETKF